MQHSKFLEDIKQRGHNVNVFYDVGANIGGWSLGAQRVFPEARFELFEPLHGRLSDVDENSKIKSINRATMHPVALSDSNEEGVIKVLDNRGVGGWNHGVGGGNARVELAYLDSHACIYIAREPFAVAAGRRPREISGRPNPSCTASISPDQTRQRSCRNGRPSRGKQTPAPRRVFPKEWRPGRLRPSP